MHDRGFAERFRSKNASPPHTANTKQQKPATPGRPRAKRLIGAPLEFVAQVCRLTEGRAAVVMALCIYRRTYVCSSRTVTLPAADLAELGISRWLKADVLRRLQAAGLVRVENSPGRTAKVTLLWKSY